MPIIKEGRIPLAKLTPDDSQKSLSQIGRIMNDMLQRHDYPEDVQKIVNNFIKNWVKNWHDQGVAKRKYSFEEFNNNRASGISRLGIAQINAIRRRSAREGKLIPPGKT